jgi:autotransporter-associated beta strand protein
LIYRVLPHLSALCQSPRLPAYLAYRYRPSPSGTLRVRLTPYQYNNTLHLYGLTNEEVAPGGTGAPPATVLTLTGAPSATDYPGAITGDGLVAVAGPGTQAFSGVNTTPDGLAVTGGAAALHAGAVVTGPAAVSAPGALHVTGAAETGGLTGDGALALGLPAPGDPSPSAARIVFLSDDASTGISPDKRYTHLYDLGNLDPAVINGVAFAKVTGNTPTFTASPVLTSHNGNDFSGSALGPVPTASALYTLLKDMTYISAPNDATWGGFKDTVITLSGLTPGKPYELRIYNRSWGWGGGRQQLLAFCSTADGLYRDTFTFNPDALAPNALVYRYAPEGDTLSIKVSAMSANNGWHLYGLSNEDLADPDAAAWAGGLTVAVPADRTDTFAGPIAGPAPLVKIGAGTLFLTGSSSANGAFTVAAGAFGAAFTDAAPLTAGPVAFAPGTAYVWNWSAAVSGGTLAAGSVTLPEPFTVVAGGTGHPPARWPVIVSENAPLTPEPETVTLQGFPNSVKAEYSGDRRILYLVNRRGTVLSIQ